MIKSLLLVALSLLGFWYFNPKQDSRGLNKIGETNLLNVSFEIPVEDSPEIQYWFNFYLNRPHEVRAFLTRSEAVVSEIRSIFYNHSLPEDLIYLPMVESGFLSESKSHKNALGLWQFLSLTAKSVDLKVEYLVDERKNPYKASLGAAKYLTYLYNKFQNWDLALVAYNLGEGKLKRIMVKNSVFTYEELARSGLLPKETTNYVPKFKALMILAKNPHLVGYTPKIAGSVDKIWINSSVDFIQLVHSLNWNYDEFRKYNPEFKSWYSLTPTSVHLPKEKMVYWHKLIQNKPDFKPQFKEVIVNKGISLKTLVKKEGLSEKELLILNPKLKHFIAKGTILVFPIPQSTPFLISAK